MNSSNYSNKSTLSPTSSVGSLQESSTSEENGIEAEGTVEKRQCWICYGEETVTRGILWQERQWVQPCKCRGTSKWVHQNCLLTWIDSQRRQGEVPFSSVSGSGVRYLVTPKTTCPQCHAPYQLMEKRVLPIWLLKSIDWMRRRKEDAVTYGAVASLVSSVWLLSASYGASTVALVLGPEEFKKQMAVSNLPPRSWSEVFHLSRIFTGIPLLPVFSLSLQYPALAWTYPLIPFLTYSGGDSLRWKWPLPKSTLVTFAPFMVEFYNFAVKKSLIPLIKKKLSARQGVTPGSIPMSPISSQPPDSPPSSLLMDGAPPQTTNSSPFLPALRSRLSPTITNDPLSHLEGILSDGSEMDDEEEEEAVRVYLFYIASTLMFPAASALVGWLLFSRTTNWSPFTRAMAGGSILTVLSDSIDLLYWWQKMYTRSSRRVLDFQKTEP